MGAETIYFEVRKNGNPQPNCNIFIYDEHENLMSIIKTDNRGISETALYDIPYKFKAIDESYKFYDIEELIDEEFEDVNSGKLLKKKIAQILLE